VSVRGEGAAVWLGCEVGGAAGGKLCRPRLQAGVWLMWGGSSARSSAEAVVQELVHGGSGVSCVHAAGRARARRPVRSGRAPSKGTPPSCSLTHERTVRDARAGSSGRPTTSSSSSSNKTQAPRPRGGGMHTSRWVRGCVSERERERGSLGLVFCLCAVLQGSTCVPP